MLMCYIYCSSLGSWLFFASSSILFTISFFVLKRGVMQRRFGLRQLAFFMMFVSVLKIFIVDAYLLRESLLCGVLGFGCSPLGLKLFMAVSIVLLIASTGGIFLIYHNFIPERRKKYISMQQARVRTWANVGMGMVSIFILWLVVPWTSYLITGEVSALLTTTLWRYFAIVTLGVILTGFWKYEDCNKPRDIQYNKHTADTWKPKDTLWLALVLLVLNMAFFSASDDILLKSGF